jgi:hypothetical protein
MNVETWTYIPFSCFDVEKLKDIMGYDFQLILKDNEVNYDLVEGYNFKVYGESKAGYHGDYYQPPEPSEIIVYGISEFEIGGKSFDLTPALTSKGVQMCAEALDERLEVEFGDFIL